MFKLTFFFFNIELTCLSFKQETRRNELFEEHQGNVEHTSWNQVVSYIFKYCFLAPIVDK